MSESIPETFRGKLGPLPVWAWGAIIGVGIVAYVWFSGKTDDAGETDPDAPTSATSSSSLADAIDGAFLTTPANGGSGSNADIPDTVDTNSAWGMRAIAALIGKGILPLSAQQAIAKYLDEQEMTSDEAKLVNQAIGAVGQPPESVGVPKVAGPPAAAKPARYIRNVSGQIYAVSAEGVQTAVTDAAYIALGMPALASDQFPWKYHTAAGNSTTLASIAAKYKTTTEKLIVLNRYTSGVQIKKGTKVKVPSK